MVQKVQPTTFSLSFLRLHVPTQKLKSFEQNPEIWSFLTEHQGPWLLQVINKCFWGNAPGQVHSSMQVKNWVKQVSAFQDREIVPCPQ